MNIENELKLIPTKDITRKQIIDLLKSQGIGILEGVKLTHQEDTYFDDEKGTLEKSGGSFRIRRKKDGIKVTYKTPIKSDTEYKQRKEYEVKVPKEYLDSVDMDLAIQLLKKQFPEITFPKNMHEILTVINDRNKADLICPDGTIIEMAFDTLQGREKSGEIYSIKPEIEFETKSGYPKNLITIYEIVSKAFPGQISKNSLSKYARAKREIKESHLTLEEASTCALFSAILNSNEFSKLKYKGQVLHRYDKPTIPQLDNFKDFEYLIDVYSKIKKGQHKLCIPKEVAEQGIADNSYEVKDDIDLEDMFCLLLAEGDYKVADEVLVKFLDKKYFQKDKAATNRLSHSQQVMLGTGLACKSSQVNTTIVERLTCMISAIAHDIGHVPLAHVMEEVIRDEEGFFSHEANGRNVVNRIFEQNVDNMVEKIKKYFPNATEQEIIRALESKRGEIGKAIADHSRSNSETRGIGANVQIPRAADKIHYVVSDICDLIKHAERTETPINILDNEWIEHAIKRVCKDRPYLYDKVRDELNSSYIKYLKNGEYGRAVVNTINSIRSVKHGGHEYYDVDQDMWDFMVQLIKRTKHTRIEMGIDDSREKMKQMSRFVLVKITNEYLQKFNGDKEKARQAAVAHITNMGEIDLLQYARNVTVVSNKQLMGEEPITKDEMMALKKQICMQIQKLGDLAGKNKREIAKRVRETQSFLQSASDQEIIAFYSKLGIVLDSEIANIEQIRKTEDTQLKIRQTANISIDDIFAELNLENIGTVSRHTYRDSYYWTSDEGRTISIRKADGENTQTLLVKNAIPKNVKQINRHKYETTGERDLTIEQMVSRINQENPGLNVSIASNEPMVELIIRRIDYVMEYEGEKVIFSSDMVTNGKGKVYREIEIKCPENNRKVTEIKKRLQKIFGDKIKFTKKSKIDHFLLNKRPEEPDGENR